MQKTILENTIKKVNESVGSIFTKKEVINLLNNLLDELNKNEKHNLNIDEDKLNDAIHISLRNICLEDYIQIDSPSYSVNHCNEISLDNYDIEINETTLANEITSNVKKYLTS